MNSKKHKARTSAHSRSFSHAFGDSRHNINADPHAFAPQWQAVPPGLPVVETWLARDHKRHLAWSDFPRPLRHSPSLRSTTATASDSQEPPSLVSDRHSSASTGTSSHYSGFNSAVYASQIYNPSQPQSQIHSLLDASCTSLVWDVRTEPKTLQTSLSASQIFGPNALSFPLTSAAAGHIRIVSPNFPWSIEIGPKQRGITASEVLHALYDLLSKDLDDVVWALADEHTRSSVIRSWKSRSESDPRIKKVDWLGKRFMFKGLYRDDKFMQQRLQPGVADVPETLLVTFGKA